MLKRIPIDNPLKEQEINSLINHFVDKLIDNMVKDGTLSEDQAYKLRLDENKNKLINTVKNAVCRPGEEIKLNNLTPNDPFLKRLIVASVSAIIFEKNIGLDKLDKLQKDVKKENILSPKELEKLMPAAEVAALQQQLLQSKKEIDQQLNYANKLRPEPKPDAQKEKQEVDSVTSNLLGLLSKDTGGFAATVFCVVGNYYGIQDFNPNQGYAPIDAQNKIDDTAFGDPLGLNAEAMENYLQFEGDGLIDQMQTALATSPSLKPPGA